MSKKPSSLVHQTSTTTGSGNFTLSAVNGKRSFNTAFGNGVTTDVFDYFISNQSAAEWEIGTGHMSDATTLVRDTVVTSSNANAAVNFSAGTKDVTNDIPANENVFFDLGNGLYWGTSEFTLIGTNPGGWSQLSLDNSTASTGKATIYVTTPNTYFSEETDESTNLQSFFATGDVSFAAGDDGASGGTITFKPAPVGASGLTALVLDSVASAVNYLEVTNAPTGDGGTTANAPIFAAAGSDSNIGFNFNVKGAPFTGVQFNLGTASFPQVLFKANNEDGPYFGTETTGIADPNDALGGFFFNGINSGGDPETFAGIDIIALDATASAVEGRMNIYAAGGAVAQLSLDGNTGFVTVTENLAFADAKGIFDDAGNEQLIFQQTASAVNYLEVTNAATAGLPIIAAQGSDTNVGMQFNVKGNPDSTFNSNKGPLVFNLGGGSFVGATFVSTNSGGAGPQVNTFLDATGASAASLGGFNFGGKSDTGVASSSYISLNGIMADPTNGSETCEFNFQTITSGSGAVVLTAGNGVVLGDSVGNGGSLVMPGIGSIGIPDAKGIFDGAGNEQLIFQQTASAVNYLEVTNAATGGLPQFTAAGSDADIGLRFTAKGAPGAGIVFEAGSASGGGVIFSGTDATGGGIIFQIQSDTASPADGDATGSLYFAFGDGISTFTPSAFFYSLMDDVSAQTGSLYLGSYTATAETVQAILSDGVSIGETDLAPGQGNLESSGTIKAGKRLTSGVVALIDGATPALDASLGNLFVLTAAGDRTIAVPSNAASGQKIVIRHEASGGARTLALNTGAGGFRFGADITGLTATTSGKSDYIGCIYDATDSFWDVVSYVKGF